MAGAEAATIEGSKAHAARARASRAEANALVAYAADPRGWRPSAG